MIKVRRKIQFAAQDRGRLVLKDASHRVTEIPIGKIPRIARLMALAIHFDRLIREGRVKDVTELAQLAHVTQPRMTQILNLIHLAPDIQEQLLHLPRVVSGRERIYEKMLRPIAALVDWQAQRRLWAQVSRAE